MTAPAARSDEPAEIRVSAVVIARPDRRVLTVRKAGTAVFMFPGGKHEPGETPLETAVRETREETGLRIRPDELVHSRPATTATTHHSGCPAAASATPAAAWSTADSPWFSSRPTASRRNASTSVRERILRRIRASEPATRSCRASHRVWARAARARSRRSRRQGRSTTARVGTP
ncbi:NUDIX domain-containing protein [Micrococcus sp. ACRRV]|uniref:NUDIX hydrolase n=1 Tax=Micrococcus sp. ACRRV TaxID=2918203 RepID=UPI001EF28B0B|nr:NUDIX domain-containing protein [Micrococcus sp. ACRRV]MCG7422755.1 NUDIX domain-containing protein [Micrococcus sp. ACRRV]